MNDIHRLALGVLHIRFSDVFVLHHLRQHTVARLQPAFRMAVGGRVIVGRADDPGQESAFAESQLPQVFAEINHAGLSKPANTETSAVA